MHSKGLLVSTQHKHTRDVPDPKACLDANAWLQSITSASFDVQNELESTRLKKALELVKATAAQCDVVYQCNCHGAWEVKITCWNCVCTCVYVFVFVCVVSG